MLKWILASIVLIIAFYFSFPTLVKALTPSSSQTSVDPHHLSIDPGHSRYYELTIGEEKIHFNLLDPGQAPLEIRDKVQQGFKIISQTTEYAKEYNGGALSCINCHFCGGNTFDGKNGSISLVGAPYWFPEYSPRDGKMMTLIDRINNCFIRSLNGKIPPADGPVIQSIVAYLEWISSEVKNLQTILGEVLKCCKANMRPTLKREKRFMSRNAPTATKKPEKDRVILAARSRPPPYGANILLTMELECLWIKRWPPLSIITCPISNQASRKRRLLMLPLMSSNNLDLIL